MHHALNSRGRAQRINKNGLITVDHVNPRTTRKDVKLSHGFRKFFETMLVNSGIHETIIRKLTGHSDRSNLTQLYSKQTEEEMLDEYMKASDRLTINEENRLRKKVDKLEVDKTQFDRLAAQIRAVEAMIK
jgi:integrase